MATEIVQPQFTQKGLTLAQFGLQEASFSSKKAIAGTTPSFWTRLTTTDKVAIAFSTVVCIILLSVGSMSVSQKVQNSHLIKQIGIKGGALMQASTLYIGLITALFVAVHMQRALKRPDREFDLIYQGQEPYLQVSGSETHLIPLTIQEETAELPHSCSITYFKHGEETLMTELKFQAMKMQCSLFGHNEAALKNFLP